MPVVQTRLEQLQVLKLLQSVRAEDKTQIEKLATNGIPDLINYSGRIRSLVKFGHSLLSINYINCWYIKSVSHSV